MFCLGNKVYEIILDTIPYFQYYFEEFEIEDVSISSDEIKYDDTWKSIKDIEKEELIFFDKKEAEQTYQRLCKNLELWNTYYNSYGKDCNIMVRCTTKEEAEEFCDFMKMEVSSFCDNNILYENIGSCEILAYKDIRVFISAIKKRMKLNKNQL